MKTSSSGMRAADLGAAPGGWTWVLTRHGLRVQSVDNGPLRQHVLDSGLVEHLASRRISVTDASAVNGNDHADRNAAYGSGCLDVHDCGRSHACALHHSRT